MFPKIGTEPDLGVFGVPISCEPSEKSNDDESLCVCTRFVGAFLRTDQPQGFSDLRGYIWVLANGIYGGCYLTDIHQVSGQHLGSCVSGGSEYKADQGNEKNRFDILYHSPVNARSQNSSPRALLLITCIDADGERRLQQIFQGHYLYGAYRTHSSAHAC